jgi:hypothetical protein
MHKHKDATALLRKTRFGGGWLRPNMFFILVLVLALAFLNHRRQVRISIRRVHWSCRQTCSRIIKNFAYVLCAIQNAVAPPPPEVKHGFWHLLAPATQTDLNLCKVILSAAILNYSMPTLVNWNRKYDNPDLSSGGSHLAKIPEILEYLTMLGPEYNDDLVLIVDGYDTWFQLKPDVLLSRYLRHQQKGSTANIQTSLRRCFL